MNRTVLSVGLNVRYIQFIEPKLESWRCIYCNMYWYTVTFLIPCAVCLLLIAVLFCCFHLHVSCGCYVTLTWLLCMDR